MEFSTIGRLFGLLEADSPLLQVVKAGREWPSNDEVTLTLI